MFSKRKSITDHPEGLDEPVLRPHARARASSPRRSSFHGSEPQLHDDHRHQHNQDRKKKYATAPLSHHHHQSAAAAAAAAACQREKPATPVKNKNIPQPTYQKTFIAMLKGKDSRASKRRSQEFAEFPAPRAQTPPHSKPPSLPPKPASGTFYQPIPPTYSLAAPRVMHAGLNHHNEQLFLAEPLAPAQPELARLSPCMHL